MVFAAPLSIMVVTLMVITTESTPDPLANPAFTSPGIWEYLREIISGGIPKELDCMQVEVTSVCPGRCVYCPHTTEASRWRSRSMDAGIFAALWPLMRTCGRVHLQGWGEPLLHPRFFDFAALARKAGCQVSTTSCGLHMNDNIAQSIVSSGMDIVAFSLVGTDARSNAPRAGVPFENVCQAIEMLHKVRTDRMAVHLEIHLAYLMLADCPDFPHSMEAVLQLPALMERLGVHAAVVSTLDYMAAPQHQPWAFAPHEKEKIAKARSLLEQVREEGAARGKNIYYSLPNPDAPAAGEDCRENIQRNLYIDADGVLAPCIYLNLPTSGEDPQRRTFGQLTPYAKTASADTAEAAAPDALSLWHAADFSNFRQSLTARQPQGACVTCPKRFEA